MPFLTFGLVCLVIYLSIRSGSSKPISSASAFFATDQALILGRVENCSPKSSEVDLDFVYKLVRLKLIQTFNVRLINEAFMQTLPETASEGILCDLVNRIAMFKYNHTSLSFYT